MHKLLLILPVVEIISSFMFKLMPVLFVIGKDNIYFGTL